MRIKQPLLVIVVAMMFVVSLGAILQNSPGSKLYETSENVTVQKGDWIELDHSNIVRDSEILYNSSGSYVNASYEMNYQQGMIKLFPDFPDSIGNNATIDYDFTAHSETTEGIVSLVSMAMPVLLGVGALMLFAAKYRGR